ncbi:FAD-dependent oxidoreductase [uncultured Ruminococcus sp.]|uniref:FAD-dependent oxidoreductase n=1 Tax=uncultured Ruminococcus sp. TaxID=165186 RepID=UPI0026124D34|nr:FAD-dependent oxidoreductase [uncultured Ruminococcus sp.]
MEHLYDVIIVGGGPAGLTAAIYLTRAKYRTLVLEKEQIGGQIAITSDVENYPGILETSGSQLMQNMRQQAIQFGAEIRTAHVTRLSCGGLFKEIVSNQGIFHSLGLILATGAAPRMAGFQGEAEFRGRGVSYCATCDGALFQDMDVFVIGGGYAAAQEALFLAKYARKVIMCIRRDVFSCAKSLAEQVLAHPGIEVRFQTELVAVQGDQMLRSALLRDRATGETVEYMPADGNSFGVFVFIGYMPETSLFREQLELSEGGYLKTDIHQKTSCDGVYGAGDVCEKSLRQIVTAVSDGAVAANALEHVLTARHEMYHIPAFPMPQKKINAKDHPVPGKKTDSSDFLPTETKAQLKQLFRALKKPLRIRLHMSSSALSQKAFRFVREVCDLSDFLQWETVSLPKGQENPCPVLEFCQGDGTSYGLFFHGIPGGHEIQSFAMMIYNCAGKGLPLDGETQAAIAALPALHLEIAVTLSCTMCPDTVIAASRLALLNPRVQTDIYVLQWHEKFRKQHGILSVPCILCQGKVIGFGKRSERELLQLIQNQE